jgi:rhamnosyltransferase
MAEDAIRTAAVVVVYACTDDLRPMLTLLKATVGTVVLIDNDEAGNSTLAQLGTELRLAYLHSGNRGGIAGGYNRSMALLRAEHPEVQQVVFLDQDSDPATLQGFLHDPTTQRALADPQTAAVSPAYRDRATGMRGRYIDLHRLRLSFFPREFGDLRRVAFVINSMSVWRMQALQRIGAFNEGLAVDHVDTEYCLRARQAGLGCFVNGAFEFAHSIGHRKKYRVLGMEVQAGGHPPQRRYMIARNTVWLARCWVLREPAFAALCMARLVYEAAGIVMAEDRVASKLAALVRGAASGLVARSRAA